MDQICVEQFRIECFRIAVLINDVYVVNAHFDNTFVDIKGNSVSNGYVPSRLCKDALKWFFLISDLSYIIIIRRISNDSDDI